MRLVLLFIFSLCFITSIIATKSHAQQGGFTLPQFISSVAQECASFNERFSPKTAANFCACQAQNLGDILTEADIANPTSTSFHNKFQLAAVMCHNHLALEQVYLDCRKKVSELPENQLVSRCRCFAEKSAEIVAQRVPAQYQSRMQQSPNVKHTFTYSDLIPVLKPILVELSPVCVR